MVSTLLVEECAAAGSIPRPGFQRPAFSSHLEETCGQSLLYQVSAMLKSVAEALNINVPDDQLEDIEPLLDDLMKNIRRALDRDLSTIDPVTRFEPTGE